MCSNLKPLIAQGILDQSAMNTQKKLMPLIKFLYLLRLISNILYSLYLMQLPIFIS